jgi:hypothetical protein
VRLRGRSAEAGPAFSQLHTQGRGPHFSRQSFGALLRVSSRRGSIRAMPLRQTAAEAIHETVNQAGVFLSRGPKVRPWSLGLQETVPDKSHGAGR